MLIVCFKSFYGDIFCLSVGPLHVKWVFLKIFRVRTLFAGRSIACKTGVL